MRVLMEHGFPGNVRELQNIIEHSFALCNVTIIDLAHLPSAVVGSREQAMDPPMPRPANREIVASRLKQPKLRPSKPPWTAIVGTESGLPKNWASLPRPCGEK